MMYIYVIKRPASMDYHETYTTPEKVLGYYTSREAVEQHLADSTGQILEVYKEYVRAMYVPEDPEPTSQLVYGAHRTVAGKYKRGWLDTASGE